MERKRMSLEQRAEARRLSDDRFRYINFRRFTCSVEEPWTRDKGKAYHPDAKYVEDYDHGDTYCAVYKCPHCGLEFHNEVAS